MGRDGLDNNGSHMHHRHSIVGERPFTKMVVVGGFVTRQPDSAHNQSQLAFIQSRLESSCA
eukprot:scaffold235239_cov36-Tisochrysis_lutea.AAC.3